MKYLYFIFTLSTVLLNCMTKDLCKDEFRTVSVKTYNIAGPVVLDSAFTTRVSNNEKIRNLHPMASAGIYKILDDSYAYLMISSQENFVFHGFKGGVQVVNEPYVIAADECNISKVSGKDSVLVQ